ncbi:MAG: hypothetical protein IPO19_22580 [Rhodoferax sp.]|nr:hypothetical protein [Rhodoferax sp.]
MTITTTTHLQARARPMPGRVAGALGQSCRHADLMAQQGRLIGAGDNWCGPAQPERRMRAAHLQPFAAARLLTELAHAL